MAPRSGMIAKLSRKVRPWMAVVVSHRAEWLPFANRWMAPRSGTIAKTKRPACVTGEGFDARRARKSDHEQPVARGLLQCYSRTMRDRNLTRNRYCGSNLSRTFRFRIPCVRKRTKWRRLRRRLNLTEPEFTLQTWPGNP